MDDLEHWGRRNTLRFHNCPVPTGNPTPRLKIMLLICVWKNLTSTLPKMTYLILTPWEITTETFK